MGERSRLKNLVVDLMDALNLHKIYRNDNLYSEAGVGIDLAHHQIHEGRHFVMSLVDTTMEDGDEIIIAFRTGDKNIHVLYDLSLGGAAHLEFYESPSWDNNTGGPIIISNRNRQSSITSTIEGNHDGTWTANRAVSNPDNFAGAPIYTRYSFATRYTTPNADRSVREHILKKNTTYGFKVVSDADGNSAQLIIDWYELD